MERLVAIERDEHDPPPPEAPKENEVPKMNEYFTVLGAGQIEISNSNNWEASEKGFSFGVSWGVYGFAGGLLSNTEAKRLAEHILKALEGRP